MERVLGAELRRLANLCNRCFEQAANRKLVDTITGANGWIIGYIGRKSEKGEPVYQRDVEKRFGVTRSTASKVVSLMVQKGLILQKSVDSDKRLRQLVLTERAWEVKRLMDADRDRFEETLIKGFSSSDLEQLFSMLERMQSNLRDMTERKSDSK